MNTHLSSTAGGLRCLGLLLLGGLSLCLSAPGEAPDATADFHFERVVRPILAAHCFECHGADKQKSELRLDNAADFYRGGSRGSLIGIEGEAGLMLQAINYVSELRMPPKGKLGQEEIAILAGWLNGGAPWPAYAPNTPSTLEGEVLHGPPSSDHWAYQAVATPPVPATSSAAWSRNAVDTFLLAQMEAAGLSPAPQADRYTLLRRLSYDLTGLPPSPEELAEFVGNDAPDAYDRAVERLLESPHYGERWARHWLDVVRYTDSFDSRASSLVDPVEIWRYRDWVVRAFNEDMPYDQFVRMQIAGDLLPAPDGDFHRDGLIATGMLAIGNWPLGDADKEKMVADIVDDQIDVVSRAFLGTTLACARCHDHKFDPFPKEDYYALAGIFYSSSILPGPGAKTEGSPMLHLPLASAAALEARAERESHLAGLRGELEGLIKSDRVAWARAEAAKTRAYLLATRADAPPDATLNREVLTKWKNLLNGGTYPLLDVVARDIQGFTGLHSRRGATDLPSAVANDAPELRHYITIDQPAHSLVVHPSPTQPARIEWRSPITGPILLRGTLSDADGTCGDGVDWYIASYTDGREARILEGSLENGGTVPFAIETAISVTAGGPIALVVAPKGNHACDSTAVALQIQADDGTLWDLEQEVVPHLATGNPLPDDQGNPAVWWLLDGTAGMPADPELFAPWRAAEGLGQSGADGEAAFRQAADTIQGVITDALSGDPALARVSVDGLVGEGGPFWLDNVPAAPGSRRADLAAELATLEADPLPQLELAVGIQEGGVPTTEFEGVQDIRVHVRGDYNHLGEVVPRRMPLILAGTAQPPIAEGSGRRELADWVASTENVLTARVMVNRIWQHHFGTGLVRTPGDFGLQGEAPTHPALLDYLARYFMDSGWSVKELHRLILHSAAWQQDSRGNDAAVVQDPENRLFARQNRTRLEAEALRDSLLAASGRLDRSLGGPAFSELAVPRRTLYLRSVRSDRSTYAMLFDAADPTSIISKRVESIVSPQALFLMNHPFVLGEAEKLAQEAARSHPANPAGFVGEVYRRIYGRSPSAAELALAEAALPGLGYPAEIALTAYTQVLLNTNEFVFVD